MPTEDVRVQQAQTFTLLCAGVGVLPWGFVLGLRILGPRSIPLSVGLHWWTLLASIGITLLYAIAGWGIGRRDPRAGFLALALFSWRLIGLAFTQHPLRVGALLTVGIGIVGIVLVLRAAQPLRLRLSRPVA